MTYRQGGPNNAPQAMLAGSGLLVWRRITCSGVVLEPAFRVAAGTDLLSVAGPDRRLPAHLLRRGEIGYPTGPHFSSRGPHRP